jgi:hypothetical protein
MSYRFTNTDKWDDAWFTSLTQIQMLLFMYLCDNCDIAGFIEVNYKRWATDLNSSPDTILGASEGLGRGLIFAQDKECIFIRNFLRHQKNLPLNENNNAHRGILARFEKYKEKFGYQDYNELINAKNLGAREGLASPTGKGKGNGNGFGNGNEEKSAEIILTDSAFDGFKDWVKRNTPNVAKMKEPFTLEQFYAIRENYTGSEVYVVLLKMHNWAPLLKKNTSAYLTANNWLNKDKKDQSDKQHGKFDKPTVNSVLREEYMPADNGIPGSLSADSPTLRIEAGSDTSGGTKSLYHKLHDD